MANPTESHQPSQQSAQLSPTSISSSVKPSLQLNARKRAQVIFNHIKVSSDRDGPFAIKPNKTVATNIEKLNMKTTKNVDVVQSQNDQNQNENNNISSFNCSCTCNCSSPKKDVPIETHDENKKARPLIKSVL